MARLRDAARRYPVLTFWLIAVALAALIIPIGIWLLARYPDALAEVVRRTGGDLNTNVLYTLPRAAQVQGGLALILFYLTQPATPLFAAFITAALIGRDRVRELVRGYRFWHPDIGWRSGVSIWLAAILTIVFIKFATAYLYHLGTTPSTWPGFTWSLDLSSPTFWFLLLTSLFFDGGGMMEETGWRGFAFPELEKRLSPLRSAIVLGVIWSLWHIPVKLSLLFESPIRFGTFYGFFTLFTVLTSIVIGYFFNRLGGSTLIGIALHGLTNDSSGLAGKVGPDLSDAASDLQTGVMLIPIVLVVMVLLWLEGERLGVRPRPSR